MLGKHGRDEKDEDKKESGKDSGKDVQKFYLDNLLDQLCYLLFISRLIFVYIIINLFRKIFTIKKF